MTQTPLLIKKGLLQACLSWFEVDFRRRVETPLTSEFPSHPLPDEVQSVLTCCQGLRRLFDNPQSDPIDLCRFVTDQSAGAPGNPPLFKQMILRYRRHIAATTEELREKTWFSRL